MRDGQGGSHRASGRTVAKDARSRGAERTREVWREICPDFDSYVVEFLAGAIRSRSGLDLRTMSLVTVATLAAMGRPLALELNIRMAINNGATRQEVVESLLQIAPYAGFPACWERLAVARRVFRETAETGTPMK
ncbi:carboxymuconolactone decarboxylase family protein [Singulisphaera rosea]